MTGESKKDGWDKAEVLSKFVVPVVVAVTALLFNGQVSERQQSAQMAEIAVGILSEEPDANGQDDPLRDWAIAILEQPGKTVPLSSAAAAQLRQFGLPLAPFDWSKSFSVYTIDPEEYRRRMAEAHGSFENCMTHDQPSDPGLLAYRKFHCEWVFGIEPDN